MVASKYWKSETIKTEKNTVKSSKQHLKRIYGIHINIQNLIHTVTALLETSRPGVENWKKKHY